MMMEQESEEQRLAVAAVNAEEGQGVDEKIMSEGDSDSMEAVQLHFNVVKYKDVKTGGGDDKDEVVAVNIVEKNDNEDKQDVQKAEESPMYHLSNNGALYTEFLEDQGREDNFTDLDLICCDGYIPVHRCLLMGASQFLRDLLIARDINDTTAITLPDVSIRNLKQVLGIFYAGRTLIDGEDERVVYEVMNMLGFPVTDLQCRKAKENDRDQANQVTVLSRKMFEDEDDSGLNELTEVDKTQESLDDSVKLDATDDTESVENEDTKKQNKKTEADGEGDKVEKVGVLNGGERNATDDNHDHDQDHLQQITSTTGDSESLNEFAPSAKEKNSNNELKAEKELLQDQLNRTSQGIQDLLELDDNHNDRNPKSDDEDVLVNEDSDRNSDVESLLDDQDQLSQSTETNASHSIISDLSMADLNFEEACNDLQKQVAKPIIMSTDTNGGSSNGYEMKLRKRKSTDNQEITKVISDDKPKMKTRSSGGSVGGEIPVKKKKLTPRKAASKTGTKSGEDNHHESDEVDKRKADKSGNKKSREKSPDRESTSSVGTRKSDPSSQPEQRRLSNGSSTTTTDPINVGRTFIEVKYIGGIKYHMYGLMDPDKGVQSGKMICVLADSDKTNNNSSIKN